MVAVALGPPWSWAKMAEEWEAQRREREGRGGRCVPPTWPRADDGRDDRGGERSVKSEANRKLKVAESEQ